MKQLLATVLSLFSVTVLYGANPSYDAFIGTNGIIITSNPPQGRVIVDGRFLTSGVPTQASLLWTNEPSGRIHPIEFTNRVEVQRSITIGTNSASYAGAPNSNDFLFAYRDITKGERYGPKFGLGVISNSISATIDAVLLHNHAGWNISSFDEGGNQSAITMDAIASEVGPTFILVRTNSTVPFGVSGTNITLHNVQYIFPQVQGSAGTVLTNNGAGVLGWGTAGAGGGLTTNENQFLGVPLSIKDSALLTNTVNRSIGLLGTATNILTAPQFLGTNVVFDGSLSSWFQFNPATGPETNYVFTNIAAGQTIRVSTFVTNGTTVRLWANTAEIPAGWYVGNNGGAFNISSNTPSIILVSRDSLIPATNVTIQTRDLETVAGSGVTFTTNFPAGTVTLAATGGGSGITNLFSLTLSNSTIKPIVVGVGNAAGATNTTGEIRGLEAGSNITLTPNGSNYVIAVTGGSGLLSGTTNFFNLSVQAGKLPSTNYAYVEAGYPAWELRYDETNDIGARANLNASWQFMVPQDYTTNTLSLLISYSLASTNGPNTSNVIFGASCMFNPGRNGTTNNVRTNIFRFTAWITNDWPAKYDGANYVTNVVLNLGTNAGLMAGDMGVLNFQRDAVSDTFGGSVAVHALQALYTRQ